MTKPNEAPSNEQEVLALAPDCGAARSLVRLVTGETVYITKFTDEELQEFASKLRAKDADDAFAMRAKDAIELRTLRQQLKACSEIQKHQAATLAQLKEENARLTGILADKEVPK